jgi:hypothetical protein
MAKKPTKQALREELRQYRIEARRRLEHPTPEEQAEIDEGGRELMKVIEDARIEEARKKLH